MSMPEVSRFLGIKIFMYFNEYNPPHFHVEYNKHKASININANGKIKPFRKLENIEKFKQFQVDYTLKWNNGLDLAPEFLYFKAFENDSNLQKNFMNGAIFNI